MSDKQPSLSEDKSDLLAIIEMRFGQMDEVHQKKLNEIDDFSQINRLILVAANAPTLDIFLSELNHPEANFKIVGDNYDPLSVR